MKTYVTYGFFMALGGLLVSLVLFFLGYHNDPAKFGTGQWLGALLGLGVAVTLLILGTKARRAQVPATEDFGYGRALGAGAMISLFGALFGIVMNYAYFQYINPGISDVIVQSQLAKLEAKGLSSEQLERAEQGIRMFMKPAFSAAFGFIMSLFWGIVISLITAAFLKRPALEEPI